MNNKHALERIKKMDNACLFLIQRFYVINEDKVDKKLHAFVKAFKKKLKSKSGSSVTTTSVPLYKSIESELRTSTEKYKDSFYFIKDLLLLRGVIYNFLSEFSVSPILPNPKINRKLVISLMDMIVNYGKLSLCMTITNDVLTKCYIFLAAYELANKQFPPGFKETIPFLNESSNILMQNQLLFINFGIHLVIILENGQNLLTKWNYVSQYQAQHIFSPERLYRSGEEQLAILNEFQIYLRLNEWIVFGFLMALKDNLEDKKCPMIIATLSNSLCYQIGPNMIIKCQEIFEKVNDYIVAHKYSEFKSVLKVFSNKDNSISSLTVCKKSFEKLTYLIDSITKLYYYFCEEPRMFGRYFSIVITALTALRKESLLLVNNIQDRAFTESLQEEEKLVTTALWLCSKLVKALCVYKPVILQHLINHVKTETPQSLEKYAEALKAEKAKSNELKAKINALSEILKTTDVGKNRQVIEEHINSIVESLTSILSKETNDRLIKKRSAPNSAIEKIEEIIVFLNEIQDKIDNIHDFDSIVYSTSDVENFYCSTFALNIYNKSLMQKQDSGFKYGLSILKLMSVAYDMPPALSNAILNQTFHLIQLTSNHFLNLVNSYIILSMKNEEDHTKVNDCFHKCALIIGEINETPIIRINSVSINIGNVVRDKLINSLLNMLMKFSKNTERTTEKLCLPLKSPSFVLTKLNQTITTIMNFQSCFSFDIQELLSFLLLFTVQSNDDNSFINSYANLFLEILKEKNVVISYTLNKFIVIQTEDTKKANKGAEQDWELDYIGNKALQDFCQIIGLQGLRVVGNVFYAKLTSQISLLLNQLALIEPHMDSLNEKNKKLVKLFESFYNTAILLGKTIYLFTKIVTYVKDSLFYKNTLIKHAIKFCTSEKGNLPKEGDNFLGPFFELDYAISKIVHSMNIEGKLDKVGALLPLLFEIDCFQNARFLKQHNCYSEPFCLAVKTLLDISAPLKNGKEIHQEMFEKLAKMMYSQFSSTCAMKKSGNTLTYLKQLRTIIYMVENSKLLSNLDTSKYLMFN